MIQVRPNLCISSIDAFPLSAPNACATVSLLTPPLSSYPQLQPPPPLHLFVPISDTPTDCLLVTLRDTLPFIHRFISSGVLIHCFHGTSRSVATLLAYLLWTDPSKSPNQHLEDVRAKHPGANPSAWFLRQLDAFFASATHAPHLYAFPSLQRRLHPLEATELLLSIKYAEPVQYRSLFLDNPAWALSARCRICRQPLLPGNSVLHRASYQNVVSILPVKWMASSCVQRKGKLRCSCGAKVGRFDVDALAFEMDCSAVDWVRSEENSVC